MRSIAGVGLVILLAVVGGGAKMAHAAAAIDVTLCKSLNGDDPVGPTTQFSKESPEVYAAWKSSDVKQGQAIKAVWIAEDVGKVAPPNYHIAEKEMQIKDPVLGKVATWWSGNFSLSKPTNGWPLGKYRLEIYLNGSLNKTLKFSIK